MVIMYLFVTNIMLFNHPGNISRGIKTFVASEVISIVSVAPEAVSSISVASEAVSRTSVTPEEVSSTESN